MALENVAAQRQRWTQDSRRRKEPTLYDEWLNEEKTGQAQHVETPRRGSTPLRRGDTASSPGRGSGTIRAVTEDESEDTFDTDQSQDESPVLPERGTNSFEQAFIPHTTTTISGGPANSSPRRTDSANKSRKLFKEREGSRDQRASQTSPPSSRNGHRVGSAGMVARGSGRSDGQHAIPNSREAAYNSARPRTRTLEDRGKGTHSPTALMRSRHRIGSVDMSAATANRGADYLASVPATISPPSAPSMALFGSPAQMPVDTTGRRSISPLSTNTADAHTSSVLSQHRRRILHLMKTLNGRMSGNLSFRRGKFGPWTASYCFIKESTGSLMYESTDDEGAHRMLIPDLRGCSVNPNVEGEPPYLEVNSPYTGQEVHLKLSTQSEFDGWWAALLHWQPQNPRTSQSNGPRPPSTSNGVTSARPEPPPRSSSARHMHRDRVDSNKSDRRKSVVSSLREAPVIKIGKMIYWDTNVGYTNSVPAPGVGQAIAGRPQAYRVQSYGSRRWRRISGQLRENGELKLHSDIDNSLISVVQLSQLSRCAIQRLDPSVLDNEFCIAIYPQYTSTFNNTQPGFLRPIFLSLESRVLYEVWLVLLRAFTIPQLYGPAEQDENGDMKSTQDLENMLATTTTDMFRMERSFAIRIVEAKIYPAAPTDSVQVGGHGRTSQANSRIEQHGYYAEILLDNETRSKTAIKADGLTPLWGESFEFHDLPSVLTSASVVIKRRPPDAAHAREQHESKLINEAYGFTPDQQGGFTSLTFDVTCGKVEIYLQELEEKREVEKWWPVINMLGERVGDVLIKAKAEEAVILMARDYQPLDELLHRFSNALTLQIAHMVPNDLKRLSDCLLDIYQVSGRAGDWIMALVEEEIDGVHKETPISRLRYSRRIGSDVSHDGYVSPASHADRELIVRDLNKSATVEANLLFRGNTLLTKSLDSHMRRVGKEYLELTLAAKLKELNDKDPDCEVDPNRVGSQSEVDRNLRRLFGFTQEVWSAIVKSQSLCPVELRVIFRHIRACAEDRYGDFLRSVSYSSVSGFLFLRFFCPAVLNPKLFGLLKEDIKPRARRTFTLIAKSLQTLANMASFGTKEPWMEPMNQFLTSHRETFKTFINDVCHVPTPIAAHLHPAAPPASVGAAIPSVVAWPPGFVSAETHLAYTTPTTIMHRLPPTSREGFPSLPYLIDQARAFADLVQLWLEATTATSTTPDGILVNNARRLTDILQAIKASDGDLISFHETCTRLHQRTQECLNRAERAERPNSALSFHWEELIDQLKKDKDVTDSESENPTQRSFDTVAEQIARDASILPPTSHPKANLDAMRVRSRQWDAVGDEDAGATRLYDPTPPLTGSSLNFDLSTVHNDSPRPSSSGLGSSFPISLRQALQSRSTDRDSHSQSASATASNVSSDVSSDTEHTTATTGTTALPNYEHEVRSRALREQQQQQQQQQANEQKRRENEREKERKRVKTPLSALRKRKEGKTGSPGGSRGSDMSHVQ